MSKHFSIWFLSGVIFGCRSPSIRSNNINEAGNIKETASAQMDIISRANSAMIEAGYNISEYKYKKYNYKEWLIKSKNHISDSGLKALIPTLSDSSICVIEYDLKELQLGGDATVFIDGKTGKILALFQGK